MTLFFPNFFIPGAAKSGTTTLHELLSFHPDICMSTVKEPVYWNNTDIEHPDRIQWYNSIFENRNAKIVGESTTSYMYYSEFITNVKKYFENTPKFIFILRNPIDRCYSHYWWMVGRGQEKKSFRACIEFDQNREFSNYGYVPNYYYHFGLYGKWIGGFVDAFGEENIKIITLEQLQGDVLNTLNDCLLFLNVDPLESIPYIQANKTSKLKHPKLFHFIKKTASGKYKYTKIAKYLISKEKIKQIKTQLKEMRYFKGSTPFEYPEITKEDRLWLKGLYQSDINQLKTITNREFNEWNDFKN